MKFSRCLRRLLPLLLLLALPALAQYTATSGTTVQSGSGTLLPTGTVCFTPYNAAGVITAITPSGGSPSTGPFCTSIVNGAFSATNVPDLVTSSPAGLNYQIVVYDQVARTVLLVDWVTGVTGTTWSFDTQLTVPISLNSFASATGMGAPYLKCVAGSTYTSSTADPSVAGWQCAVNNGYTQWFQQGSQPAPGPGNTATIPVVSQMIADAIAHSSGGGGGGTPGGNNNSLQYKNGSAFGGAQVVLDTLADPNGGSIKIPTMDNTISSNLGANGNLYWTDNSVYPQQIPRATFYRGDFQFSNNDFYAAHVNALTLFGTNRYQLASAGGAGPDTAVSYDKLYLYSPNQLGGAYNLGVFCFSHMDCVGHTDTVTARGQTEGFEEGLERNRQFYGYGWYSPHGPLTLGTTDYMHHYSVSVVPTNQANTFGEENYLIDETKKFVPAGNVTVIGTSTLLGNHFAALNVDATLKAALNARFGSTLHVAQVVAGADEQKYNNACPSTVIGSWAPIVPYNPTAPSGTGMLTQNQCVTTSGDISTLTTGAIVCIWGDHANSECAYVVSKPDAAHLVISLNHQHDPGESIVWGSGVGQAVGVPRGYVPRRTLDNSASTQEEDVVFTMPMIGWDNTNSQIILWPNYSAQSSPEIKLPIYTTNVPFTPMTVTGAITGGVFTSLAATPGGNYQTSLAAAGALSSLPPPTLSFNCSVAPTYHWLPDQTVNVAAFVVVLDSGGSGCSNATVTVNNTYANPVWIYPALHLWHVRNLQLATTDPRKMVDGNNMLADAIPNLTDFTNGDIVRQQMTVNQWTTGNEQMAGSPATQNSNRFGPMRTMQWMFPQGLSGSAATDYTANATPGWYYWSDAAHNWMPSQDVSANPLLGTGGLPFAYGLGGSWLGWMHMTSPPYSKNAAGRVMGGTLIQVDCTHPGQDGAGAATPCRDQNIYPKFRLFANYGPTGYNYIDVDANTGLVDIGPGLTVSGKSVCKTDPVTHQAVADCPALLDYTITLAAAPQAYAANSFYQIGSLLFAAANVNPLVNTFYVPRDCNVSRVDYTENIVTGAVPSAEQPQMKIWLNGISALFAPSNMGWNGAGQNHLSQVLTPSVLVHAGDQLTYQINTPTWVTPPSGTVANTAVLYCQVP